MRLSRSKAFELPEFVFQILDSDLGLVALVHQVAMLCFKLCVHFAELRCNVLGIVERNLSCLEDVVVSIVEQANLS